MIFRVLPSPSCGSTGASFPCSTLTPTGSDGADELFAIGFSDCLDRDAVIVMEWCENVLDALPHERLEIRFTGSGADPRSLQLTALGAAYEKLLENLK